MKVYGPLEVAQFENIASANPTPGARGRIYADTSGGTTAVPKFHNGLGWQPFKLGQTDPLYNAGNSGKAATINWANGLSQKLTLTDNCIISFSNPVPGEAHTLVVLQNATEIPGAKPFVYKFNLTDQASRRTPYQPSGLLQSSAIGMHKWYYAAGTVPAYATIPGAFGNPNSLLSTAAFGICYSPDGKTLYQGNGTSPFVHFYQLLDDGPKVYAIGVNPTSVTAGPGQVNSVAVAPNGKFLFFASSTSPFIGMRAIDPNGNPSLLSYSNPGTLPTAARICIDVHPAGSHVIVGGGTSPFMEAYPINNGFGTKLSNPGSLPTAQVNGVAFSPQGDYVAIAVNSSPFIEVYPFDYFTGFGTKVSAPASLPTNAAPTLGGKVIAWRPQGDWIAMGMTGGNFIYLVPFDRGAGTFGFPPFLGPPFFLPAGNINGLAWSPDGQFLAAASSASPQLTIWAYNASGGITLPPLPFDGGPPGVQANDVVWHPSGELVSLSLNSSPFVMTYTVPRVAKNYLKLLE
ncbi:MAG: WD40 repeat domain-containing protein [Bdellovibrionales bacterium]|nr:WD40 repeat domain-containing protein [Bdellovibrionales bacterium]